MNIKELIITEIDKIPEEKLDDFYQLLKEFININDHHKKEVVSVSINRIFLDQQYQIASQKISQQFDSEWLETLETEDDLLQAAVELTKHE